MNNETCVEKLAEHKWKLYNTEDAGLLPDGQVMRYIDGISHRDVDSLVQFLEKYVSVSNYLVDDDIRYAFCTAPLIDNQPKAGNWRSVQVRMERVDTQGRVGADGSTFRLVQTLAEGFLTALSYADARLVKSQATPGDTGTNTTQERYLTLEWVGVDPDSMEALTSAKAVTSVVADLAHRKVAHNGTVVTVLVTGDWHPLAATSEMAQDGSATVRWLVADPEFVLEGFSSWLGSKQSGVTYYYNVPEALAQGVMDAAKARGSDVSASNYDADRGLVDLRVSKLFEGSFWIRDAVTAEDCDSKEETTFALGVKLEGWMIVVVGQPTHRLIPTELLNGEVTYRGSDGLGYLYKSGAYWWLQTNLGQISNASGPLGSYGTQTVASSSGNLSQILPVPTTIPAGVSYSRNVQENGDGSYNVVLRKQTRKYRNITEYDSEMRADQDTKQKEWKGVTDQDLSADLATAQEAGPGGDLVTTRGPVVQVRKEFRADCSIDITRNKRSAVGQKGSWTFKRGENPDGTLYWGQNQTELPPGVLATTWANVSPSIRINEFGLLDYTISVMPVLTTVSSSPPPYTNYSENFPIGPVVQSMSSGGKTYTKTYTGNIMFVAGNSNADTAGEAIATCDYKVSFNPMGNGKFFHAKGIKLGNPDAVWVLEGELPTS